MSGLFLSYSRADRVLAEQIVRAMRAVGVAAWWDEDMSAVDWQMELAERIHELSGVLVIWTEESLKSVHVRDEARLALQTDKLVNVMAGVTSPPFPFDRINGFHLDDWTGREPHRGWSRVVAAVEELVVQKGGAQPGEITVAQAMREEKLRELQKAVGAAQQALQRLQAREAEAGETKRQADVTVERAQDQLQRVAEMRAGPTVLRAAQQEFDAAFEVRQEAAATLQKTRRDIDRASTELATAMDALEALAASSEPLSKVTRTAAAPTPRPRPHAEAPPPAAEPDPPARAPRKPRAAAAPAAPPRQAAPAPEAEADADADDLAMAAPAPAAVSPPAILSALPVGRRPLIAAGVGLALAVVVGAIFLVFRPQAASASHPEAATVTIAALDPQTASAAAALAGKWAFDRADCATPMTLSVSGDQLSLTSSGTTEVATIQPGAADGTVRTHGAGGDASYALRQGGLTMTPAGAAPTQLARCAG